MKKILIFSNMDQIGDGIIKLPFIHAVKERFPDHFLIWATNTGETVYKSSLMHISNEYIDQIYVYKNYITLLFVRHICKILCFLDLYYTHAIFFRK